IAKTKHDIVVSFDDDMQITKDWFKVIKKAIQDHPDHYVFTCPLRNPNKRIVAGRKMTIKNQKLYHSPIHSVSGEYQYADWGPIGCLVVCRKALLPKVKIPNIFKREDACFYLEMKKFRLNATV